MTELSRIAKKMGNSTVIVLDKTLQELSGIKANTSLTLKIEMGSIGITKTVKAETQEKLDKIFKGEK